MYVIHVYSLIKTITFVWTILKVYNVCKSCIWINVQHVAVLILIL